MIPVKQRSPSLLPAVLCGLFLFLLLMPLCASAESADPYFSKSDYNDVVAEPADAVITLEGDHGTLSDTTRGRSGNPVVIERKGIYRITGSSDGVTIQIREPKKSGNVYLILENVSMVSRDGPCIASLASEKTIVQCTGDSSLTCSADQGAALYAEDDLTVNGSGRLTIESGKNGIQCKGVLRITGSRLLVRAENDGLKGKHGIYMDGGSVTVEKSYEGLEGGQVLVFDGNLQLTASDDGINAASDEGRLQGDVRISGGSVAIHASGDAIDSNHSIVIDGGTVLAEGPGNNRNSIFDKGDGADAVLCVNGGTVLAVGSAEKAKNFSGGTQYSRLEPVSGHAGDVISADDGSGVQLVASRDFSCVIYSSPSFTENSRIQITSGSPADAADLEQDPSVIAENPFMAIAVQEALEGITCQHGGPFGCVIVKDGKIVGLGHNMVLAGHDASAHGEIQAIRDAGHNLGTHDLSGCDLYTTGEPCPMCLFACLWANIDRVYYGCTIEDNSAIGFRDDGFSDLVDKEALPDDYLVCIDREACLQLFEEYQRISHTLY